MKFSNRLILDEEQEIGMHLAGQKITTAHAAGSFGFSSHEAEADVISLRHALDTSTEPVYITRALYARIQAAFRVLNYHRTKVDKAQKASVE